MDVFAQPFRKCSTVKTRSSGQPTTASEPQPSDPARCSSQASSGVVQAPAELQSGNVPRLMTANLLNPKNWQASHASLQELLTGVVPWQNAVQRSAEWMHCRSDSHPLWHSLLRQGAECLCSSDTFWLTINPSRTYEWCGFIQRAAEAEERQPGRLYAGVARGIVTAGARPEQPSRLSLQAGCG